jgi:hypothetical protein
MVKSGIIVYSFITPSFPGFFIIQLTVGCETTIASASSLSLLRLFFINSEMSLNSLSFMLFPFS